MFKLFSDKPRTLHSTRELRDVQMHVYTQPAGLIGNLLGRALKIRVDRFSYEYSVAPSGVKQLQRVSADVDSLVPVADVDERKFERLLLSLSEVERVGRRTRSNVLNAPRFPEVHFDVESETDAEIKGTLRLHGESGPVTCKKQVEGSELVVSCKFNYTAFGVPVYKHLFGLLAVAPEVEVVSRVPAKVLL